MPGDSTEYSEIVRDCKKNKVQYSDPWFPAEATSILYSRAVPQNIQWKRPSEIVTNPKYMVDGGTRFDVVQGRFLNSWFVSAVQALTLAPNVFNKVVMPTQSFDDKDYVGAVRFNFWIDGAWKEVIIDDRLPTYPDGLFFMHSSDPNEFWSALLEKAYAKVNGSYEALKDGDMSEAMTDLTGGVTEVFDLKKAPSDLFKDIRKANKLGSLVGCSIKTAGGRGLKTKDGLLTGVGYAVTGVAEFKAGRQQVKQELIRIRSPRDIQTEWKGNWSDKSAQWHQVSDADKRSVNLTFEADGEFWMSYSDFLQHFDKLEICNLEADSVTDATRKHWNIKYHNGEWVKGVTAGGCRNFPRYADNPQYRMTMTEPEDDGKCYAVIALMQKGRRKLKKKGLESFKLGFAVFRVLDESTTRLDKSYIDKHRALFISGEFTDTREVVGRFSSEPGNYIIIPTTFNPDEEATFLLRVYTSQPHVYEVERRTTFEQKPDGSRQSTVNTQLEDQYIEFFRKLAGVDEEIDVAELNAILNRMFKPYAASVDDQVCKKLISKYDDDNTGKLKYRQFLELYDDLQEWKKVFDSYDIDKSGDFSSFELRSALSKVGINIHTSLLRIIVKRFSDNSGKIGIVNFIACIVTLKALNSIFEEHTPDRSSVATFTLDEFLEVGTRP